MRSDRPLLLYRHTCGKCRLLSRLAVAATQGSIARASIASPLGCEILRQTPAARDKLLLLDGDELVIGWRVIRSVLRHSAQRLVRHG